MNLPEEFLKRMKERLGEEFPAFLRSYEAPAQRGLRVNALKLSREEFLRVSPFCLEPVPWEDNGFYLNGERAGAHPYHAAGLYYLQEPSAMCAVPLLGVKPNERVLDLCAAPGGKATQIAAAMEGRGVFVANEYEYDRAKILSQNFERLGVKNAVVTCADAARLSEEFESYFDKILVDAPCSGEGMFKKEENAVPEWSVRNTERCAVRQRMILDEAAKMLAAGGRLVYSTCTFAEEEDERQTESFLRRHPGFHLLSEEKLYPHRVRGEGHYAALLEKTEGDRREKKPFPVRRDQRALAAFSDFAADFFRSVPKGEITTLSDGRMFLLPALAPATGARILRAGVELGSFDGKIFKPAHALAMSMRSGEAARVLSLGAEETEAYLRGETLSADAENGWCLAGVDGYPLGLAKAVNGTLKNHLPKGLRR